MSFKFRRDGAVFPTEVSNGELIIHAGADVRVKFKFLTDDFMYDNTDFPMCNVMCYLRNENMTIIMRFDETVTKFDNNMNVVGFSHFKKQDIYSHTIYLPIGCVEHYSNKVNYEDVITSHTPCSIYSVKGSSIYCLECIGDPEPIVFTAEDNTTFMEDIARGTRMYPRLVRADNNLYQDGDMRYIVHGNPIHRTRFLNI